MINEYSAKFYPVKLGEPAHVEVERDAGVLKSHDFHHGGGRQSTKRL